RTAVPELVHRAELPGGVHVEQREGRHGRIKGLHREMQHHRAVLAGGIEHHRPLTLRDYLAQDMDALGLEPLEMAERGDPRQLASRRLPARSRPGGGAGLISGHGRQSGGSPALVDPDSYAITMEATESGPPVQTVRADFRHTAYQ